MTFSARPFIIKIGGRHTLKNKNEREVKNKMAKVFTRNLKTKEVHYTTAEGVCNTVRIDDVPEKKGTRRRR